MKHNKITLAHGETYKNNTTEPLFYVVEWLSALGLYQVKTEQLKPSQSITKTNPSNKITIYEAL
jgi:hypothetical protein